MQKVTELDIEYLSGPCNASYIRVATLNCRRVWCRERNTNDPWEPLCCFPNIEELPPYILDEQYEFRVAKVWRAALAKEAVILLARGYDVMCRPKAGLWSWGRMIPTSEPAASLDEQYEFRVERYAPEIEL